jgi:hypothetical protein
MTNACCCCFDDELDEFIECSNNHSTCKECVINGVSSAVGNLRYFKCPHESKCELIIPEFKVNKIVDKSLADGYSEMIAYLSTKDLPDFHKCSYCDYGVIIEINNETQFHCLTCEKVYCIQCKKDAHPNQPCNAEIYAEAEALSLAVISYGN